MRGIEKVAMVVVISTVIAVATVFASKKGELEEILGALLLIKLIDAVYLRFPYRDFNAEKEKGR